jgi:hypothetical protein
MSTEDEKAIQEARKKFGELYGNTKLGGKGKKLLTKRNTKEKKISSS